MVLTMPREDDPLPARDEDAEFVRAHGTFTVGLVPRTQRHYRPLESLEAHETVLRPLLTIASECLAFGLDRESEVFRSAASILSPWKGKYRVRLNHGDPIRGHEFFWNAQGGRRGTIVILVPNDAFARADIFRKCHRVAVMANFLSAHTPSAIRFARTAVTASPVTALCLSRNNGMEWMDVHAASERALQLYEHARDVSLND
jgi:hypothetical protein